MQDAWTDMNAEGMRHFRQRNFGQAATIWQQVVDGGDLDAAPVALESLASLTLFVDDRPAEAEAGFVAAVASGHPNAAPRALAGLAEIRLRQGLRDEAETLVDQAARLRVAGDTRAAETLAVVFGHLDRLDEAAACYVEMSADSERSARAFVGLGWIRWREGQSEEAKNLWRQVIDSPDRDAAARASYNLGAALQAEGLREEARDAYRRATETSDPDLRKQALAALQEHSLLGRTLTNFLPVAAFVPILLPHGWIDGVGFLVVAFLLVVFTVRRRSRNELYKNTPIALAIVGVAIVDIVYANSTWPTPILILACVVVGTLYANTFALPVIRRAYNSRRPSR